MAQGHTFLFGKIPTQADFGIYGQLRQWINDPFPASIMYEYPGAWSWVLRMDDLSGYDIPDDEEFIITDAVKDLFRFSEKTYFPFLLANSKAVKKGKETREKTHVHVSMLNGTKIHKQPSFSYQAKCLEDLQLSYSLLNSKDSEIVRDTFNIATLKMNKNFNKNI